MVRTASLCVGVAQVFRFAQDDTLRSVGGFENFGGFFVTRSWSGMVRTASPCVGVAQVFRFAQDDTLQKSWWLRKLRWLLRDSILVRDAANGISMRRSCPGLSLRSR